MIQRGLILFAIVSTGVFMTACKQESVNGERTQVTTETSQFGKETSSTKKTALLIDCPLKISQTQGGTDVEYLAESGNLVKTTHATEDNIDLRVQFVGFCNDKNATAQRIEIRTNLDRALDPFASSFSVIDVNSFKTIGLSPFFKINEDKTGFYVPAFKVQNMWASLPAGRYEFSANLVSQDFEVAHEWTFNLEIR